MMSLLDFYIIWNIILNEIQKAPHPVHIFILIRIACFSAMFCNDYTETASHYP